MAMKAAHAEDNADQNITGSTRQHIVSRLHKAAGTAKSIAALVADTAASGATDADVLEARAYAYALAGAEEFEKQAEGIKPASASPQRWSPCLTSYSAARVIYSALLKATHKDLFKEVLAATTDPSIRYAAYQSRIPRTVGVPAVSRQFFPKDDKDLVDAVQQLDPAALHDEDAAASSELPRSSATTASDPSLQTRKSHGVAERQASSTRPLARHWSLSMLPPPPWTSRSALQPLQKTGPPHTTTSSPRARTQSMQPRAQSKSSKRKASTRETRACRTSV